MAIPVLGKQTCGTGAESVNGRCSSFGWCIFIVAVATIVVLRFAWAPLLMLFVFSGVSSAGGILAVCAVI